MIRVPSEAEALIRDEVARGLYASAEEAIATAVDLLDQHDRAVAPLRAALLSGIDQLDRGEGVLVTSEWSAERLRIMRQRAATGGDARR